MKVALTGGIACGKSKVAEFLRELGVETIDADDIVHELIPDPEERRRIAAEVFADAAKRKELEEKLHPLVKARLDEQPGKVAIIPLLFEKHWEDNYDVIGCVVSSRDTQIARMMGDRGYSQEEALNRLAAQMPVEGKAAKSHYIIRNDSTLSALKAETEKFVEWMRAQKAIENNSSKM